MLILDMKIEVPAGVLDISGEFQSRIEEIYAAAYYIADAYKYYVAAVGAVDTGQLLDSIHVESGSSTSDQNIKYVVASAPYAKVVELGWTERGEGQSSYPGRYPAQKAFEFFLEELTSGRYLDSLQWRYGK